MFYVFVRYSVISIQVIWKLIAKQAVASFINIFFSHNIHVPVVKVFRYVLLCILLLDDVTAWGKFRHVHPAKNNKHPCKNWQRHR